VSGKEREKGTEREESTFGYSIVSLCSQWGAGGTYIINRGSNSRLQMVMADNNFDPEVIIVGAGVCGSALAAGLGRQG